MTSSSLQALPLYLFATCTDKHMDKKEPKHSRGRIEKRLSVIYAVILPG